MLFLFFLFVFVCVYKNDDKREKIFRPKIGTFFLKLDTLLYSIDLLLMKMKIRRKKFIAFISDKGRWNVRMNEFCVGNVYYNYYSIAF